MFKCLVCVFWSVRSRLIRSIIFLNDCCFCAEQNPFYQQLTEDKLTRNKETVKLNSPPPCFIFSNSWSIKTDLRVQLPPYCPPPIISNSRLSPPTFSTNHFFHDNSSSIVPPPGTDKPLTDPQAAMYPSPYSLVRSDHSVLNVHDAKQETDYGRSRENVSQKFCVLCLWGHAQLFS